MSARIGVGVGGAISDDKFVYVNHVCFDVGCFLSLKFTQPRDHLGKGSLGTHCCYYYYYYCITIINHC